MKILTYRWKAYNQKDIVDNLIKRGHIVEEITGEMCNFDNDEEFREKFANKLDSDEFDMVFTVNYFPIISDVCQARNVRYISWCCDSPLGTMYHESIYNSVNTVFEFDKINQLEFAGMGANVFHLPLCSEVERVEKILENADDLDKYECDISFVGSMYNKNSYDEVYDKLPEYLKGYFDAGMKLQMNLYGEYMLDELLDSHTIYELNRHFSLAKSDRSFSDMSMIFSTTVLGFKIAQMERKSMLASVSRKFDVDLYTDDKNIVMPRVNNRGLADYWNEAPKIFNRSKINLNFTIRNIRSGIPLRVWDILGAGGFCITNYQQELGLYFENGKDIVYFEDKNDLMNKIKYYLTHDEERKQIARNGCEKVRRFHNYQKRFDEMNLILQLENGDL